jgi:hypothetical protein
MFQHYGGWPASPILGYVGALPGLIIPWCCTLYQTYHAVELPPFIPNDYLFETHKDKGRSKSEIYAWAVRDAMSKALGVPKCDYATLDRKA